VSFGSFLCPLETLENKGVWRTENIYGIDEIWERKGEKGFGLDHHLGAGILDENW